MVHAYSERLRNLLDNFRGMTVIMEMSLGKPENWAAAWDSVDNVCTMLDALVGLGVKRVKAAMELETMAIQAALEAAVVSYIQHSHPDAPPPNAAYLGKWEQTFLRLVGMQSPKAHIIPVGIHNLRVLPDLDRSRVIQVTNYKFL